MELLIILWWVVFVVVMGSIAVDRLARWFVLPTGTNCGPHFHGKVIRHLKLPKEDTVKSTKMRRSVGCTEIPSSWPIPASEVSRGKPIHRIEFPSPGVQIETWYRHDEKAPDGYFPLPCGVGEAERIIGDPAKRSMPPGIQRV